MIKAIDTTYKSYKFRSRLEARFAVFMDALNIKWDYEVEGFNLPINGNYLPDFYLPNGGVAPGYTKPLWIEVKAAKPTQTEISKLRELVVTTKIAGAFFVGTKGCGESTFASWFDTEFDPYCLPVISNIQIPLDFYIPAGEHMPRGFWKNGSSYSFDSYFIPLQSEFPIKKLRRAAKAALSARFEFGESG